MTLSISDLRVVIDALAKAAARHESQARSVRFGRHHEKAAEAMRDLRRRFVEERNARAHLRPDHPDRLRWEAW